MNGSKLFRLRLESLLRFNRYLALRSINPRSIKRLMSLTAFLGAWARTWLLKKMTPLLACRTIFAMRVIRPSAQFIIPIVIVELLLHVARAPALRVAAVKADVEKPGIGDDIEPRKQPRQIRFIHRHQGDAAALQLGKDPVCGPGCMAKLHRQGQAVQFV